MENEKIIEVTKSWIEEFVIHYSICPFAKLPYEKKRIRFHCDDSPRYEAAIFAFSAYVQSLSFDLSKFSNAFLIYPQWNSGFRSFLDLTEYCYHILEEMNLSNTFQLVCFHPQFHYQGENADSATSLTNQSPFPMIHILQVEEVTQAIEAFPDSLEIAKKNKYLLENMDVKAVEIIKKLSKNKHD